MVSSKFQQFTVQSARKLPVILLADVSGSMSQNGKIQTLNRAIAEMIESFAAEEDVRAAIYVAVITFGRGGTKIHQPLLPANQIQWTDMQAAGRTPMAEAFDLARIMVEDKNQIASRDYHPTVVLVSDGHPTDDQGYLSDNWKQPLQQFLDSERASKALRLAMGIGEDADEEILKAFLTGQDSQLLFRADESGQIRQFFRFVTMSVTNRSQSVNPNSISTLPDNFEDLDF
ncbi:VWA domain-containing protein [Lyngbya sp. CCY1209]|uniref:vWA domain-containing protein n=1 Tax=Lyngbya sp. CCY1209 TaxID=2886103 RepID=UPI002D215CB4|nr:VWA domain-containing protein [Lyngbya sp. CCY1209]MEB3882001.1 VWA domain-containing protein [Lyngbya sp. CCY1209]